MHNPTLTTTASLTSDALEACITDRRPEIVSAFDGLTGEQLVQLIQDSHVIGVRAVMNAQARATESRLQDVGKSLMGDLERQLEVHVDHQHRMLQQVVGQYFDPKDGSVSVRLDEFTRDEGPLARILQQYLGPQNSVLAETLARQVGQQSELFRKLSPTESDGLVQVLEGRLKEVMSSGHTEVVRALDPQQPDGAVARFLRALRGELGKAEQDRHKQLQAALAALDANDEQSLISRLMRETHQARRSLMQAINPDVQDSPMASIKNTLTAMLGDHIKSQQEALEAQRERQAKFEREVLEAIARIESRRGAEASSPRGGFSFEDAVVAFVHDALSGAPYLVEATGNSVGLLPRRKLGDVVVRFTADSAFDGAALVVETKRDASYSIPKALEELDLARKNRGAGAGVFVMASTHAAPGFPRLARYGHNVLVMWDEGDSSTDPHLHAALLLGLALATRKRHLGDPGDIQALADIEQRITAEVSRLDKIRKANEAIRRQSDSISDELRKGQKALERLVDKAKDTLKALNIELHDEDVERTTPIGLDTDSLDRATDGLKKASGE
ncbi:MAG: hypothetical protein RLP09_18525 [Sandaracinaceae bacterium]